MTKEEKVERYRKLNKSIQPGQTVFAGSSLMEMFPIEKLLQEKGEEVIVYNRGIGGYMTHELMETLDVCVLDLKPSRVFINIGTNDLSWSSIPISDVMANYDKIITAMENALPGVEIYLMAYYPVNFEAASEEMKECLKIRTNEKINAANREVEKLAKRHGQKYIDINANLKDEQGRLKAEYTIEGMHIYESGYRAVYEDIMAYVKEAKWK